MRSRSSSWAPPGAISTTSTASTGTIPPTMWSPHGHADSRHRRPALPRLRWPYYPEGIPIEDESAAGADCAHRRRDVCHGLQRPLVPAGDEPASIVNGGRRLHDAGRAPDRAEEHQAGHQRGRRAHRLRQEPDEPPHLRDPPQGGQEGRRRAAPDALRRPRGPARAALRHHRRPGEAQPHHRGDGGVRAARGRRRPSTPASTTRPPARGGEGSRHHPLGRRQQ